MGSFVAVLVAVMVSGGAQGGDVPKTRGLSFQHGLAQTYSQRCKTPTSICFLDQEEKVGEPCKCGGTPGVVTE